MYIRQKGKVSGPHDETQLREMVSRGHIKMFDEASEDGVSWLPADGFEWFKTDSRVVVPLSPLPINDALLEPGLDDAEYSLEAEDTGENNPFQLGTPDAAGQAELPPMDDYQWYYESMGTRQGPISSPIIEQLIMGGQVTILSRVWREGFPGWMPAGQTAELAPVFVRMGTVNSVNPQVGLQVGPQVVQAPGPYAVNTAYPMPNESPGMWSHRKKDHRGGLILTFGILSWVIPVLFFLCFIAWRMGQEDLKLMDDERMDASGRGMTQIGMILGAILSWICIVGLFLFLFLIILGVFAQM